MIILMAMMMVMVMVMVMVIQVSSSLCTAAQLVDLLQVQTMVVMRIMIMMMMTSQKIIIYLSNQDNHDQAAHHPVLALEWAPQLVRLVTHR